MDIAIAFPEHVNARMEAKSYLVPKADFLGRINLGLCKSFDDLHHILYDRLVRHAPGYTRWKARVDLEYWITVCLDR